MKPTYKQSCQIDPTKIDFSAFDQGDIREDQFSDEELYGAGVDKQKKGLFQEAITFTKNLQHGRILFTITSVVIVANIALILFAKPGVMSRMVIFILPIAIIFFALYTFGWIKEVERRMQLKWLLFAKQNGFIYYANPVGCNNPEAVAFNIGYGGTVSNMLEFDDRLSVAEYAYKTKNGEREISHHFNFARFRLENNVPHLVLNSKFSALQIWGERKIKLEGNFQDHFTLYAPDGFHIDALQIFTPDVMSKLLDQEGKYDLELVGSDLCIYEMHQGLIESGLTIKALDNPTKNRERHSRFINFLSSVIEIASEIR